MEKVVNGTTYKEATPKSVVSWLETSRERQQRIRVFYGDAQTGKDWMEEHDTIGCVGRSMGQSKVPLLIKSSRSLGGGGILDHCIVRIDTKNSNGKITTVYRHPKYHHDKLTLEQESIGNTEYPFVVCSGTAKQAAFAKREQAQRYIGFMNGERWAK
ncbi:hypothetical protein [Paenibacillus xylanexedens]|uniref:hypothetical protein n=1 Tax=Paenibacillus xylanexedens TaxID=528191 RepID=UPI000F527C0D|nr:hypothetical protein [Paenibacillus xylanexedens]RPK20114.1 hypothetical protein EDO6_06653 [Paenibacillus xylanexedens]